MFNLTPQLSESQLQHMKQNEIIHMYYIRLFSETNRKTWVMENVSETESHPLYNVSKVTLTQATLLFLGLVSVRLELSLSLQGNTE